MYLELHTRRRRRVQNVHEPLSCVQVPLRLTTEYLSQVSIGTMSLNITLLFHPYFLVGSGSGYRYDSNAFLFSLVNKPGWAPVKLPQTGKDSSNRRKSIFDGRSNGPIFGGGHDICISNYASSNRKSYSNLGWTYSPPSGYSHGSTFAETFLAGSYSFTPDEVEAFYETT